MVKTLIVPYVRPEGDRLRTVLEGPLVSSVDKIAAEHVKTTITVSPSCGD